MSPLVRKPPCNFSTVRIFKRMQSQSPYFYKHLRVIPFRLSPEQVVQALAPLAYMSMSNSFFYPAVQGWLSSRFPELHKKWSWFPKPPLPQRVEMVYFPAWIIKGGLKADVVCNNNNGGDVLETTANVHLSRTYIPGSDAHILSSVVLRTSYDSKDSSRVAKSYPFTDIFRTQFGRPVICLPFNIWPKRILELVRERKPTFDLDGISVQLNSLRPTKAVMSPILYPLYVVRYLSMVPGERRPYTFVVEAGPKPRIFIENASVYPDKPANCFFQFINPANIAHPSRLLRSVGRTEAPTYADVFHCHIPGLDEQPSTSAMESLIESLMSQESTPSALAKASVYDKSKHRGVNPLRSDPGDPNVREWLPETVSNVRAWMGVVKVRDEFRQEALAEGKLNDPQTQLKLKAIENLAKELEDVI